MFLLLLVLQVEGLRGFSWSPRDNILSYWVAEDKDVPARVVLLEVTATSSTLLLMLLLLLLLLLLLIILLVLLLLLLHIFVHMSWISNLIK